MYLVMSDGSPSHSSEVTSKYFEDGPVMDESLSEFKEKKKSFQGPKESKKPTKPATNKPKKRVRGQKDIRTALHPKKNELIIYANDFDRVCKQSGIDVDSEQLQLAIALSKSLQNDDDNEQATSSLNTKQRTGKIRKTLQEYGFKVPVLNLPKATKRKVKKYRKDYKLLLSTKEEKHQIISDRYAQVLFRHIIRENNIDEEKNSEINLYHIATQIPYEVIRNDNFFYIKELIERNLNSVGSLLKSWSEIPGRPVSPIEKSCEINFSECLCSQDELDSILSGPVNFTQDIVKNLKRVEQNKSDSIVGPVKMDAEYVITLDDDDDHNPHNSGNSASNKKQILLDDSIDIEKPKSIPYENIARSCSPDIFDDEVSSILEKTKENSMFLASQEPTKNVTDASNNGMDFTECVTVNSQSNALKSFNITKNFQANSQLSQTSNVSKRKSNDFMEITNCVAGSSQPLLENIVEEDIDLTQDSDTESDEVITSKDKIRDCYVTATTEIIDQTENTSKTLTNENNKKDIVSLDLTQSSHSEDELPMVQISGRDTNNIMSLSDDTIILNEEEYKGLNTDQKLIEDEGKNVNSCGADESCEIEMQENSPKAYQDKRINKDENDKSQIITCHSNNIKIISETKSSVSNFPKVRLETASKSKSDSFFYEFVYLNSDDDGEDIKQKSITNDSKHESVIELDDGSTDESIEYPTNHAVSNDIELIQYSNSSTIGEENKPDNFKSPQVSLGSLGKRDNVSIDYDEIFDQVVEHHSIDCKENNTPSKSTSCNIRNSKSDVDTVTKSQSKTFERSDSILSNCSQYSEVFEISDNELNYSINQSKYERPVENFDFGGISVMDELSNARGSKSTRVSENVSNNFQHNPTSSERAANDTIEETDTSYLPMVNLGSTEVVSSGKDVHYAKEAFTPFKFTEKENISIETPSTSEYVIKRDQVTPMLDYHSMTTPERNKELDKYGLKPFKRKRAIQLLTHLYNQTHPTVESCSNECPSPSKKRKMNSTSSKPQNNLKQATQKSPRKLSPRKLPPLECAKTLENNAKSPMKPDGFLRIEEVYEHNIYEATHENRPVIKDLECSEEDWVFQKKEKAKVHSCRVPLHVAFHNYVSARPALKEAILRYEPVNIDDIHKGLLGNGLRFDPKDLLKFLDKKCITVKTADNNNQKKY